MEWTVAGEALDRRLTGLGVHAGVAHLLGPGYEAIIQLLEAGDALGLGLEQEPLADVSPESFLFPATLGSIRSAVDHSDAEYGAAAFERGVGIRRPVVDVMLTSA